MYLMEHLAGPKTAREVTERIFDDNWEEIQAYAIENHTPYNGVFPIDDALSWAVDTLMFDMNTKSLSIANQSADDLLENMKRRICEYANFYSGEYTK